jgi:hypothetical protein
MRCGLLGAGCKHSYQKEKYHLLACRINQDTIVDVEEYKAVLRAAWEQTGMHRERITEGAE